MDPRIARTQRSLRAALFELSRERRLGEISVSDVAERAGVNRSTYYQHYADLDELVWDALDTELGRTLTEAEAHKRSLAADQPSTSEQVMSQEAGPVILDYLEHIRDHSRLYRELIGDAGSARVQLRMHRLLHGMLLPVIEIQPSALPGMPASVAADAIAGAAVATVRAWLEIDPVPSTELAADWIWQVLIQLCIRSPGDCPRSSD